MAENGQIVVFFDGSKFKEKKRFKAPWVLFLIGGENLEGDCENSLKEAYENINGIPVGVGYFVGDIESGLSVAYPNNKQVCYVVEEKPFENMREGYIARSLIYCSIVRHHKEAGNFVIPKVIQHDLWERLSRSVSNKMKVWELAFLMYPVIDKGNIGHKRKFRVKRRCLMLDLLTSIKRGEIESILSLKREKEYWGLDINKQVDIVISLSEVKRVNKHKGVVFVWESFIGQQKYACVEQGIPERVSMDYQQGTVTLKKNIPKGDLKEIMEKFNSVAINSDDYLHIKKEKRNTVQDWEERPITINEEKKTNKIATDSRLSRALYIWNNWDSYKNKKKNEKRSVGKVFRKAVGK